MKLFVLFLLTILSTNAAEAKWTVNSQFELILSETLFDQVINDYWSALQGSHDVPISDIATSAQGFPVMISGIHANVDYDFPAPKRISSSPRQWQLSTNQLSATLAVDSVKASGTIVRMNGPTRVVISMDAECHNLKMHLPPALSHVSAVVQADVQSNQVQLAIPTYDADWSAGAWVIDSVDCSGSNVNGFGDEVKKQALAALSSFHNFDSTVKQELTQKLADWSKSSSGMLLSSHEIPMGKDYMQAFFEPSTVRENGTGNGLFLSGSLRFDYNTVAPNQTITQQILLDGSHTLEGKSTSSAPSQPELLVPFGVVRGLMMGEYFAGKLGYVAHGREIPSFQTFMANSLQKMFAFPELNRYSSSTDFQIQFSPAGPPSLVNERAAGRNQIQADMDLPLVVQMAPQIGGSYVPMVQFKSDLAGVSTLSLGTNGQVQIQVAAQNTPTTYAWSSAYLSAYNPNQYIAADTIASKVRDGLATDGLSLAFPPLVVGPTVSLLPTSWALNGDNLAVIFGTPTALAASKKAAKQLRAH